MKLVERTVLVGGALAIASVLTSGHAIAWGRVNSYSDGDAAGNSCFSGSYSWGGVISNRAAYPASAGSDRAKSTASQSFSVQTEVLDFDYVPVAVTVNAETSLDNAGVHRKMQRGHVHLAGQTLFSQEVRDQTCPGKTGSYGCTSYRQSINKKIFSASLPFSIGPIPMTVSAAVNAGVYGGIESNTYSARYLGRPDTFFGKSTTVMEAGAYLSSRNDVAVGIPYVAQIGLGLDFKLIDVSLTPKVEAYETASPSPTSPQGYRGTDGWIIHQPVTLNTLSGKVEAWAKLLGGALWSYKLTLIEWDGYTWSGVWNNVDTWEAHP